MKTPRDLLLNRHRGSEPQLDEIRAQVVHGMNHPTPRAGSDAGLLQIGWDQLFVAGRRWWAGLGVAWCTILFFIAIGSAGHADRGDTAFTGSEPMLHAMQERWQMRDELLGVNAAPNPRTSQSGLGPCSDIICEERYV